MNRECFDALAHIAALPDRALAAAGLGAALAWSTIVGRLFGSLGGRKPIAVLVAGLALAAGGAMAARTSYKSELASLGRNLPALEMLAPRNGERIGDRVRLLAHATDRPGRRGPIGAVRRVEFWLYHPSFAEQQTANHESKVLLAQVAGPTADDLYEAEWLCRNPYTPERDGDHSPGHVAHTYVLADDGRPYRVQAHGIDDEWLNEPGVPGKSEAVTIELEPCRQRNAQ